MTALHRLAGTQLPDSLSPITGDPCCPLPERGCEESSGTFSRPTRHVYVEGDKVWTMPLFGGRSVALRVEPPSASQAKPTATIAHRFHVIGVIAAVAWIYVMLVAALVLL